MCSGGVLWSILCRGFVWSELMAVQYYMYRRKGTQRVRDRGDCTPCISPSSQCIGWYSKLVFSCTQQFLMFAFLDWVRQDSWGVPQSTQWATRIVKAVGEYYWTDAKER